MDDYIPYEAKRIMNLAHWSAKSSINTNSI